MEKEEKNQRFINPSNIDMYLGVIPKEVLGFNMRNIGEAFLMVIINYNILNLIPFVVTIKTVVLIVTSLLLFIFFTIGIKEESVSGFLLGYYKFWLDKGIYKLRPKGKEIKEKKTNEKK